MKRFWQIVKDLIKNRLVADSLVVLGGGMVANLINYLYHLSMGRMLGPGDYGVMASLISVIYLGGIPLSVLSLVMVKYISTFRGKKQMLMVNFFYRWIIKKVIYFGVIGLIVFLFFVPLMARFLHLNSYQLLIIVGLTSFLSLFPTVTSAMLQGFLRFNWNTLVGLATALTKLILAIIFVCLGLKIPGALLAILLSTGIGYLISIFFVRELTKSKFSTNAMKIDFDGSGVLSFALPTFLSISAFTSLYTTDVILARHFLSAREAGFYAALATLGKIVFFASSPVITVMFPMVSERHALGGGYLTLLKFSLMIVLLISAGVSFIYLFFPKLMILALYGREYLSASPHLKFFAVFLSLYSLSFLLVNFYLSIREVRVVVLPVIAAILQIVLIILFHQNLAQVVWISIITLGLLLLSLLLYSFVNYGKAQKTFAFSRRSCL